MNIFIAGFWFLTVVCSLLYVYTRTASKTVTDGAFKAFQNTYLRVYLLAMAGDWMQGPYVYALYDSYGMTTHDIEVLFVAGFGSSMVFGTVVGSFADKYGRRANCILYGITYGLACITKHFNNFWILMIGRLLGGIATSILYSAFESWLIYEHTKRGFEADLLENIFSHAVLGNSLVAITSGLIAQYFADVLGYVAPFDISLAVLVVMCVVLWFTWSENYGDSNAGTRESFRNAWAAIQNDKKVLYLGLIQSLFEGSMYTFVLEWTPALTPHEQEHEDVARHLLEEDEDGHRGSIPHGYIFAAFMVSVMIGASLFKMLSKVSQVEAFMRPVLLISALSLVAPIVYPGNQFLIFSGFLIFEVCVGIFWPALSTMRSKYVPEATRATVMNCFRVPLNLIVIIILTQNLSMTVIFTCCVTFLVLAAISQQCLYREYLELGGKKTSPTESVVETTDPLEKQLLPANDVTDA